MLIGDFHEELLITGVKKSQSVGKIIISSEESSFDSFEKDILEFFIAFIRQRIVDFNKEWRNLSRFFPISIRTRLLEKNNYTREFLTPRKQNTAILYADISDFTMISEQILKNPDDIAMLIDIWSTACVHAVWENSGCFDKLVGDCIIALFSPPFYDLPAEKYCQLCLKTALEIRDITNSLYISHKAPCFEKLRQSPLINELTVSTGLNYGSVFVGLSGPNDDFSCYSSVMNNTARIQGAAGRGEIFALKDFVHNCPDNLNTNFLNSSGRSTDNTIEPPKRENREKNIAEKTENTTENKEYPINKRGPFLKKLKNVSLPLEYYIYK